MAKCMLVLWVSLSMVQGLSAQKSSVDSERILIVYLSRTQNTKTLAEIIHDKMGGRLEALELVNPYPENYRAIVEQVAAENRTGYLPPLKNRLDMENYDVVFLGFPTWGMQLPPPMKSFLSSHDLKGKTVVPFNTNGGYGIGSCIQTIKELCQGSTLLKELSIKGGSERDGIYLAIKGQRKKKVEGMVESWLHALRVLSK